MSPVSRPNQVRFPSKIPESNHRQRVQHDFAGANALKFPVQPLWTGDNIDILRGVKSGSLSNNT